eukprot:6214279-Pleurochrysis_carterae.AAC.3
MDRRFLMLRNDNDASLIPQYSGTYSARLYRLSLPSMEKQPTILQNRCGILHISYIHYGNSAEWLIIKACNVNLSFVNLTHFVKI